MGRPRFENRRFREMCQLPFPLSKFPSIDRILIGAVGELWRQSFKGVIVLTRLPLYASEPFDSLNVPFDSLKQFMVPYRKFVLACAQLVLALATVFPKPAREVKCLSSNVRKSYTGLPIPWKWSRADAKGEVAIRSGPMRYLMVFTILGSSFTYGQARTPPPPGKLINLEIKTTLVPSPAAVDVLLPPGYEQFSKPVPLFIWLHGGTSGKGFLGNHMRPFIEKAWGVTGLP